MKNILISISAFILAATPLKAFEKSDTLQVYFHQGKSEVDTLLKGNKRTLRSLDSLFNGNDNLSRLQIVGGASPEGSVNLNYNLSEKRAERILSLLNLDGTDAPPKVETSFIGRDWEDLYNLVAEDPDVPFKEETLDLLEEINLKHTQERREAESDHFLTQLKELREGRPYRYLYNNIFPSLRASRIFLTYQYSPSIDLTIAPPNIYPENPPFIAEPILPTPTTSLGKRRNFYMAIKTNMLYDLLALPSLSAEFYLGRNLSIVGNWTYGWWDTDRTHHYWRAYGGDIALRWWFGKKAKEKPLTGHHIGIYGGILTYDFEFGGTGYMGGLPHETLWNRSLRMGGIEYGYSLPIAKHLNIDFTIGIGYLGGKYIKYIPDNGRYLWQSTHKINWFGPTKAEISLVWLIGNGNYNSIKKGGNR